MKTVFSALLSTIKQNTEADIITLINAPDGQQALIGQVLLIFADGASEGEIINSEITCEIKQLIIGQQWENPKIIDIPEHSLRIFWNRVEKKRKAVIAGGGHISLPLTQILSAVGFEVSVIDDRPEFANRNRFPGAKQVICSEFTRALGEFSIDASTAVIIVTRGHRYDLDCLRAVIHAHPCYLGMIGSRRRIRSIMQQMLDEGYDAHALSQLRAPIGLDIGAQTPEEIAVSVAAEVIAVFRGGTCLPLSAKAVNVNA